LFLLFADTTAKKTAAGNQ